MGCSESTEKKPPPAAAKRPVAPAKKPPPATPSPAAPVVTPPQAAAAPPDKPDVAADEGRSASPLTQLQADTPSPAQPPPASPDNGGNKVHETQDADTVQPARPDEVHEQPAVAQPLPSPSVATASQRASPTGSPAAASQGGRSDAPFVATQATLRADQFAVSAAGPLGPNEMLLDESQAWALPESPAETPRLPGSALKRKDSSGASLPASPKPAVQISGAAPVSHDHSLDLSATQEHLAATGDSTLASTSGKLPQNAFNGSVGGTSPSPSPSPSASLVQPSPSPLSSDNNPPMPSPPPPRPQRQAAPVGSYDEGIGYTRRSVSTEPAAAVRERSAGCVDADAADDTDGSAGDEGGQGGGSASGTPSQDGSAAMSYDEGIGYVSRSVSPPHQEMPSLGKPQGASASPAPPSEAASRPREASASVSCSPPAFEPGTHVCRETVRRQVDSAMQAQLAMFMNNDFLGGDEKEGQVQEQEQDEQQPEEAPAPSPQAEGSSGEGEDEAQSEDPAPSPPRGPTPEAEASSGVGGGLQSATSSVSEEATWLLKIGEENSPVREPRMHRSTSASSASQRQAGSSASPRDATPPPPASNDGDVDGASSRKYGQSEMCRTAEFLRVEELCFEGGGGGGDASNDCGSSSVDAPPQYESPGFPSAVRSEASPGGDRMTPYAAHGAGRREADNMEAAFFMSPDACDDVAPVPLQNPPKPSPSNPGNSPTDRVQTGVPRRSFGGANARHAPPDMEGAEVCPSPADPPAPVNAYPVRVSAGGVSTEVCSTGPASSSRLFFFFFFFFFFSIISHFCVQGITAEGRSSASSKPRASTAASDLLRRMSRGTERSASGRSPNPSQQSGAASPDGSRRGVIPGGPEGRGPLEDCVDGSTLDLRGRAFEDPVAGALSVAELLNGDFGAALTHIRVGASVNGCGPAGVSEMLAAAQRCPALQFLDLSGCDCCWEETALSFLASPGLPCAQSLHTLLLNKTAGVGGGGGCAAVLKNVLKNADVRVLGLAGNQLGVRGVQELLKACGAAKVRAISLEELDLGHNGYAGAEAMQHVGMLVRKLKRLWRLNLSGTFMGSDGSALLSAVLLSTPTLRVVQLEGCQLDPVKLKKLTTRSGTHITTQKAAVFPVMPAFKLTLAVHGNDGFEDEIVTSVTTPRGPPNKASVSRLQHLAGNVGA